MMQVIILNFLTSTKDATVVQRVHLAATGANASYQGSFMTSRN